MAPVIKAFESEPSLESVIIHSGQHYDYDLSQIFIQELDLPKPDMNLKVGSGSHSEQTSEMLLGYEKAIQDYNPDLVLAEGDTNTVVAASLAAVKLQVPFGHVESGLRCYDRKMPEEINRVIADHCARLCFTPTSRAAQNLLYEGIPPDNIFITGNTIVDVCMRYLEKARQTSRIAEKLSLTGRERLVLVTIHRPENVDNIFNLKCIVNALIKLKECTVVFPMHPRTRKMLRKRGLMRIIEKAKNIILIGSLGYLDFLNLLSRSYFVLTDSGGVQEEAVTVGVPCLILRHSTERPEAVSLGVNIVVGTEGERILRVSRKLLENTILVEDMKTKPNPFGDGRAGDRIAEICVKLCKCGLDLASPDFYETGSAEYALIRVSAELSGKTVRYIKEMYPDLLVTNVYDRNGIPIFPRIDLNLREGFAIRVFGSINDIALLIEIGRVK